MEEMKVCSKCGKSKPATTEYFPHRKGKLTAQCKSCVKEYKASNYLQNADKVRARAAQYYEDNKEKVLEVRAKYRENNRKVLVRKSVEYKQQHPDVARNYRLRNDAKIKAHKREYYALNKEDIREREKNKYEKNKKEIRAKRNKYTRKWSKARRLESINYRLVCNLRGRLWGVLKGKSKSESTLDLLGCDINFLRKHLESQFVEGMSWDNYGEWHVDHKIPCASFDLSDIEQQKKCFHWSNLQPLWAKDNISKGAKYEGRDYRYESNPRP